MEFIEGVTLREKIHRERAELRKLLRYLQHVAEGLAKAHAAGIVHRDLKPDNIMITREGHAKILDFGLAKLVEPRLTDGSADGDLADAATAIMQQQSTPGVIMGTVGYMSPEQAQGKTNQIDQRSDIFSFGCILFEAVTGKKPFEGDSIVKSLHSLIYEPAPQIKDLNPSAPADLQRIVRRCLAKDKEERYQTIKDVAIELKELRRELAAAGDPDVTVTPITKSNATSDPGTNEVASQTGSDRTSGSIIDRRLSLSPQLSSAEYLVSGIKQHKLAALIAVLVLIGAAIGLLLFLRARPTKDAIESIAVMPFVNESGNADVEYLSDGMTETLISSLTQLPNLQVKPRSSVFRYKGKETDPKTIGKELNVQAILNGRVVQRGSDITLYIELIDAQKDTVLWKGDYNRPMTNLVVLQTEVARDVSNKLKSRLSGTDSANIEKGYTANPEAYKLYLRGRFYWNKRTESDLNKSIEFFNQAIAIDPSYALAYAGLADAYLVLPNYAAKPAPADTYPKARSAAQRALVIDSGLAEPHAALAAVLHEYDWKFAEAEQEFKRAIEINPNYASAHQWYSEYLLNMSRFDEALAEAKWAQQIDPLSLAVNVELGGCYYILRRYDEAIAQYKKTLEIDPYFAKAYNQMTDAYFAKGMYEEAIEAGRKRRLLQGVPPEQVEARTATVKEAYHKLGVRGFFQKVLDLEREAAQKNDTELALTNLAVLQMRMGEKEQALDSLEKALEMGRRDLRFVHLKVDPIWKPIHSEPRFQELLRKIGFPQ
jgi:serine/threonine protein kinase/tetratricopeptide (TPR) repeat protein